VSIRLEFDRTNRILLVSFADPLTDEDFRNAYEAARRIIEAYGPCSGITDLWSVTEFPVSANLVRELAFFRKLLPKQCTEVVLAPRDVIFGMARMFEILTERPNIQVVRSIEDAYTLLDVTAPEFTPVEGFDSNPRVANK
jgi:hypothetical protein